MSLCVAPSPCAKGEARVGIQTLQGDTPLHFAAANGHLTAVKLLLQAGANANRTNEEELTPAHFAASRGHTQIIKELRVREGICNKSDATVELLA